MINLINLHAMYYIQKFRWKVKYSLEWIQQKESERFTEKSLIESVIQSSAKNGAVPDQTEKTATMADKTTSVARKAITNVGAG